MYSYEIIEQLRIFEGFRSTPYKCPANRLTIGYGHTSNVKPTDRISRDDAIKLLHADCDAIDKMLVASGIDLPIYKQSALVEFCFNCGFTAFKKSRLFNYIINYDPMYDDMICDLFLQWCKFHDKNNILRTSVSLLERRKYDVVLWRK